MKIICSGDNKARVKFPESYYKDGGYCIIMSEHFDGGRFITRDKVKAEYSHFNLNQFVIYSHGQLSDRDKIKNIEQFRSILFSVEEFNNSELAIKNKRRFEEEVKILAVDFENEQVYIMNRIGCCDWYEMSLV